jgi:hypothetical protein
MRRPAQDRPYYILSGLGDFIRVASSVKVVLKELAISPCMEPRLSKTRMRADPTRQHENFLGENIKTT